jgi:NADPH:quinone reductase-like Zn-dependent oxidoreductase
VLVLRPVPAHFEPLTELCVSGAVRIHVDRVVGLDGVPEALAHVGAGPALGKVVVRPKGQPG